MAVEIADKTDHIVPEDAPVPADELPAKLPYGPVNGVEMGYQESDIYTIQDDGSFKQVDEADRAKSGEQVADESKDESE